MHLDLSTQQQEEIYILKIIIKTNDCAHSSPMRLYFYYYFN